MKINFNVVGAILAVLALIAIFAFGHSSPPPIADHPDDNGKAVYHVVKPDGSKGSVVDCKSIKPFAEGKSEAELQAIAKQYGVTIAVVKTWYICNN